MPFNLVKTDGEQNFNTLLRSLPSYSILQTPEWAKLKSDFGWDRIHLIYKNQYPISILIKKLPIINNTFLYSPHPYLPDRELLSQLKDFLQNHYRKAMGLKIEPVEKTAPDIPKSTELIPSTRIQPRSTIKVDITPDEDEIMTRFHKKTRYNVRLAGRRGVEVKRDNSTTSLESLLNLLEKTAERKNFLVHKMNYYRKMHEIMSDSDMGMVFLAYFEGEVAAGLYALKFGDTVYYPYGASDRRYYKHMPSNLLHWEIIKWGKEEGCTKYDLWGIPDNPTKDSPLWGVYRFKSGWGGEEVNRLGAYDMVLKPSLYEYWRRGLKMWNSLRNFLARGSFEDPLS